MLIPTISNEELEEFERIVERDCNEPALDFAMEQPFMLEHIAIAVAAGVIHPSALSVAAFVYLAIKSKIETATLEELLANVK